MKRTMKVGVAALSVALAACGMDTTGAAQLGAVGNALINADIASMTTDVVGQDVEVMRGPGGNFALGLRAERGKFECTAEAKEGLTITRTCVFKDASGNVQSAYDSLTTASVSVNATVKGALSRGPFSMTIDRKADFTVSGLAGQNTTAIWNGGGSGSASRVRQTEDGAARESNMTYTLKRTNVVIPVPHTANSWPISGTVEKSVTVTIVGGPHDGKTVTRKVVIIFNGTSKPVATINGEAWELDLANRSRHKKG